MATSDEPNRGSTVLKLVDQALEFQAPLVRGHIERIRRRSPEATPADVVRKLNKELRAATIGSGAAVGGSAAAPGVGTGVALALSAGRAVGFMSATALYALARAESYGVPVRPSSPGIAAPVPATVGPPETQAWRRGRG